MAPLMRVEMGMNRFPVFGFESLMVIWIINLKFTHYFYGIVLGKESISLSPLQVFGQAMYMTMTLDSHCDRCFVRFALIIADIQW